MSELLAGVGLSVARPSAAWALLLPLAFLLLVRLLRRPPVVVIGTLELWDEAARLAPRGARARGPLPLWALACALALFFGALAWLGPRAGRAPSFSRWTAVVDLSPSTQLPAGAGTRLSGALASAQSWLAAHAEASDRVRWVAPERAPLELAHGSFPDAEWLRPRPEGEPEPAWELHDEPGTLWITDRAPPSMRRHAGLFASGGPAVEGPIAADGHETVWWEGGALHTRASATRPLLSVQEPAGLALPAVLERLLVAWSEARGFTLVRAPAPPARLVVELAPEGERALELARDGWSATGRGELAGKPRDGEHDWLAGTDDAGAPHAVVRARPGLVRIGLRELSEPAGDLALFALSWSRLLDASLLPAPGVVPLAERLSAGAPRIEPGAAPAPDAPSGALAATLDSVLDSALALAAALCALLALVLRRPRLALGELAVRREARRDPVRHAQG